MLTVDDCNTIIKKYGNNGYWIDIDFKDLEFSDSTIRPNIYQFELIKVKLYSPESDVNVNITPPSLNPMYFAGYITNHDGEILDVPYWAEFYSDSLDMIAHVLVLWPESVPSSSYDRDRYAIFPLTLPVIEVINGEFDNKFYVIEMGHTDFNEYTIDGEVVEVDSDAKGTYFTLPSATSCLIGAQKRMGNPPYDTVLRYKPWRVSFREFKELPIPYIPTLYKGTPQSIQVINSEDDTPISDYQTYYQGRLLKDNTITLPYDSDEYADIMVDLKDYRYPFCTLKLKAPTTLYQADSQGDVETAIENGIQTLQIGDTQTEVTLNEIALTNVTLINSNIQLTDSTVTDCQIIDTSYTDNGGNNITNTIFNSVDYTNTAQSNYNEVTFTECDIHDSEINLTGTISKSTITDSLILSDGVINIQDNTFTGVGLKEYFPSHLYLTGDYTVTGNTFTLTGEWTELEYNMCIIKATNDFNPSNFIKQNNLQLNITYDSEPVNTFYYNLVDEDKIRAVRLQ